MSQYVKGSHLPALSLSKGLPRLPSETASGLPVADRGFTGVISFCPPLEGVKGEVITFDVGRWIRLR